MSEDIGPGDVVEALHNGTCTPTKKGDRFTVRRVRDADDCACESTVRHAYLILHELDHTPIYRFGWCEFSFRKIGGSQSDTVTRFAHHLITDKPKVRA